MTDFGHVFLPDEERELREALPGMFQQRVRLRAQRAVALNRIAERDSDVGAALLSLAELGLVRAFVRQGEPVYIASLTRPISPARTRPSCGWPPSARRWRPRGGAG